MAMHFNVVAVRRPTVYVGTYSPAANVIGLGLGAAMLGISKLFNSNSAPRQHVAPLHYGPPARITHPDEILPETRALPMQPRVEEHRLAEPPPQQVQAPPPTPFADALDGAKGLKNGSKDREATLALQKFLTAAGYGEMLGKTGPGHDGIDGVFKGKTENALEKFQEDHGLPKTGVLDTDTLKKMHEVEAGMQPQRPDFLSRPSIDMPHYEYRDPMRLPQEYKSSAIPEKFAQKPEEIMMSSAPEKALKVAGEDLDRSEPQMSVAPKRPSFKSPGMGGM